MRDIRSTEIPFRWTCPTCKHAQGDTVNPIYGPFVSVICHNCGSTFYENSLDDASRNSFNAAVDAAEAMGD